MTGEYNHRPVMLKEAIEGLAIRQGGVYVDGTFGRGGHAKAILEQLGPKGVLLAMDKDPEAARVAIELSKKDKRFFFERGSFAMLDRLTESRNVKGKVNGILLDLGVSSPQLDDPVRGFSFLHEGPLDMRMDTEAGMSASEWLNSASETDISTVIKKYGEERYAKRIAMTIVELRKQSPIMKTNQLVNVINKAVPKTDKTKHPATRTFQAIRIFINHELEELQEALPCFVENLMKGGRLVVISFHSLEDRIVKRFIRSQSTDDTYPSDFPVRDEHIERRMISVGKAIRACKNEVDLNPRSRSAIMRIAERL